MSVISAIGVMLLVLTGIVLLCLAAVWLEKLFPGKAYDERQERSQGRAYRLSFYIGLMYYGFMTMLLMNQQKLGQMVEPYLLVLGGILLQIAVYRIYCMITQSFMRPVQKLPGMICFDLILGIIAILCYWVSHKWNVMEKIGYPATYEWLFLILAVMLLFFAVCWLCQLLWQRLRGERE